MRTNTELSVYVFLKSIHEFLERRISLGEENEAEKIKESELYNNVYRTLYEELAPYNLEDFLMTKDEYRYLAESYCPPFEEQANMLHEVERVKIIRYMLEQGMVKCSSYEQAYYESFVEEYNYTLTKYLWNSKSYNDALYEFNKKYEESFIENLGRESYTKIEKKKYERRTLEKEEIKNREEEEYYNTYYDTIQEFHDYRRRMVEKYNPTTPAEYVNMTNLNIFMLEGAIPKKDLYAFHNFLLRTKRNLVSYHAMLTTINTTFKLNIPIFAQVPQQHFC